MRSPGTQVTAVEASTVTVVVVPSMVTSVSVSPTWILVGNASSARTAVVDSVRVNSVEVAENVNPTVVPVRTTSSDVPGTVGSVPRCVRKGS